MKRLVLMIAVALPQVAGAQSDPFMDLSIPSLEDPAPQEGVMQSGEAVPPQRAAKAADTFMDLAMPSMSDKSVAPSPYGCPPQERPAWEAELPIRESYKSVLLLNIYEAIWIRNVERDGTCNCDKRVPAWDEADLIYQTLFANLESGDQIDVRLKLSEANRLRLREVDKLCNEELQ